LAEPFLKHRLRSRLALIEAQFEKEV